MEKDLLDFMNRINQKNVIYESNRRTEFRSIFYDHDLRFYCLSTSKFDINSSIGENIIDKYLIDQKFNKNLIELKSIGSTIISDLEGFLVNIRYPWDSTKNWMKKANVEINKGKVSGVINCNSDMISYNLSIESHERIYEVLNEPFNVNKYVNNMIRTLQK